MANLKLLSNVTEGQIIKVRSIKYKVSKTPFGILLTKELMPGIFGGTPKDVAQAIPNYSGAKTTFVEVVEVASAPKTDLTSQLRQQQSKQSLTDSLRAQQIAADSEADDDDDEDYEDEEEDDEEEEYTTSFNAFNPHAHSEISRFDIPQYQPVPSVEEVKKSALSANLKAQQAGQVAHQAQQSVFNAHLKINDISKGIAGLSEDVGSSFRAIDGDLAILDGVISEVGEATDHLDYRMENLEGEVDYLADQVYAIKQKQIQEEKKMSLQNELNRKLAAQKQQNELQAQLNQKLNQKTTGGNGTMKKLLGNAFNFGKVEGKFAFSPITGGLALRKGLTNEFVAYNKDTKELTDVSGLTLKFDVPAFKLPVASAAVEVGDLVIHNGEFVYVTKKVDGYLETLNPEKAVRGSVIPTKNALLGAAFYTVVKTLDAAGQGGFNPMLLMAMNKGGNSSDLLPLLLASGGIGNGATGSIDPTMLMLLGDDVEDLLPLVLMQQGGATGAGFNPLMFLAMNKGGKSKDLLPLLMMSGGLNGAAGQAGAMNPMMMMALAGDGDMDPMMMMALSGGFGQGGLFGQAPAVKEVKGNK